MPLERPLTRRWCFADQIGPHFLDHPRQPVLLVESRAVFRRRRFHRRKAHLVLYALRRRARELGDQAVFLQVETYREALHELGEPVDVCAPTSYAARRLVQALDDVEVLPERGFATTSEEFARWAAARGGRRLLLEDFYRDARRRLGLLMDGGEPAGGRWNFDTDNREPPPGGAERLPVRDPWWPVEDDLDAEVRETLDRWEADHGIEFVGRDGPRRFAGSRREALAALRRFVTHRLDAFGPYEDAMLAADPWMAHSMLSATLNLGLLDPLELAQRAEQAYRSGQARLASVEGYVRQVVGWRDYVWNLYWHLGEDYRRSNALAAHRPLPGWFDGLDADAVEARCLSTVLGGVRDEGWVHHIPRLMVLGNWAAQRGYDPEELTEWYHRSFVDGYDWVMVPNVVGMSQHADGGVMATKPYVAGGAYIDRMSDLCGPCRYDPKARVGEHACPFTAGYWWYLNRNRNRLAGNHRMTRALRGLERRTDLAELVEQEESRGPAPP